jgi:hypothetical protein
MGAVDSGWRVASGGTVELTLGTADRQLVAKLSEDEIERLRVVLDAVVDADRRNEFSRVKLGTGAREAIGRDPFRQPGRKKRPLVPWWADLAWIVVGISFASAHHPIWQQVLGYGLALAGLGDLVARPFRR